LKKNATYFASELGSVFCHRCSRGSEQGHCSARIGTAEDVSLTGLIGLRETVFSFVVFEQLCQLTGEMRLLCGLLAERGVEDPRRITVAGMLFFEVILGLTSDCVQQVPSWRP